MHASISIALLLLLPACGASGGAVTEVDSGPDEGSEVDAGPSSTCAPYEGPAQASVAGNPGDIHWQYPYAMQVEFAPAIAPDGTVVVQGKRSSTTPEDGPTLIALDPSGSLQWGAVTDPGSVPAPPATIHCGQVLAPGTWNNGELNSRLYRFELDDGTALDPFEMVGPVGDGIAVGGDGTLYVPATPLHAIRGEQIAWTYSMVSDGKTGSNAAVGPSGTIYVGARGLNDHNLHAVSPDGTEKWKRDVGNAIIDPIAIDFDERIYALNSGGLLSVFDSTGELAWTYQFDSGKGGGGMIIGPDGTVYVGTTGPVPGVYDGEYLYAVRQGEGGEGELVWRKLVGLSWITTTPALSAGGTLYVTDFCRNLIAVNAADGEILWDYAVPGLEELDICAGFSAPTIGANGVVYAFNEGQGAGPSGGNGGGLYAFVGDGTGPAPSAWAQEGMDGANTGRVSSTGTPTGQM